MLPTNLEAPRIANSQLIPTPTLCLDCDVSKLTGSISLLIRLVANVIH